MWFLVFSIWIASGQLLPHISNVIEKELDQLEITELSREYINNKFPITQSSCVKNALGEFLEICMRKGFEFVDADLRVITAVRLSVCEFESSGLTNYPSECHEKRLGGIDTISCVNALESSPQWWTTYSGNYQNLPHICMENSLPFEKEQILELFLNITDMYSEFQRNIENYWKSFSSDLEINGKENIDMIQNLFNSLVNDLIQNHKMKDEELITEFDKMKAEFDIRFFNFTESFDNLNDEVNEDLSLIKSHLIETFRQVDSEYMAQLQKNKNSTDKAFNELESMSTYILDHQKTSMELIDSFFSDLIDLTRDKNLVISDELMQTQEETIHLIFQYNKLVHESVIPLLTDDLLPVVRGVSNSIVENLDNMNVELTSHLENVSQTIEVKFKASEKETDRSLLKAKEVESNLRNLNNLVSTSLKGLQTIVRLLTFLLKRQVVLVGILQIFLRKYISMNLYLYAIAVVVTALAGSKVGSWGSLLMKSFVTR